MIQDRVRENKALPRDLEERLDVLMYKNDELIERSVRVCEAAEAAAARGAAARRHFRSLAVRGRAALAELDALMAASA